MTVFPSLSITIITVAILPSAGHRVSLEFVSPQTDSEALFQTILQTNTHASPLSFCLANHPACPDHSDVNVTHNSSSTS